MNIDYTPIRCAVEGVIARHEFELMMERLPETMLPIENLVAAFGQAVSISRVLNDRCWAIRQPPVSTNAVTVTIGGNPITKEQLQDLKNAIRGEFEIINP